MRKNDVLTPLPLRVTPSPWEYLASLIARTARKMGYPDPKWILAPQYASCHLKADALPLATRTECSLLATLLGLDEENMYLLTLHRFATRLLHRTDEDTGRRGVSETFGTTETLLPYMNYTLFPFHSNITKVCPRCLDEQYGYDRLYWRAAPILSCPRHHVFLRARCPDCQSSIPALRPQLSLCPSCRHGDYRRNVFPLPGDINWLVESQALFLHHLGVETPESGEFRPGESLTLRHLLPPDYFWIVTNFLNLLVGEHGIAFLMQALSFEAIVPQHHAEHALLLLHYLLSSWPAHFWVVLDLLQCYLKLHAPRPRGFDRLLQTWEEHLYQEKYWSQNGS